MFYHKKDLCCISVCSVGAVFSGLGKQFEFSGVCINFDHFKLKVAIYPIFTSSERAFPSPEINYSPLFPSLMTWLCVLIL